MKAKRRAIKKIGSVVLALAIMVSGIHFSPIKAEAAKKKVSKITLSAPRKKLYIGGPASLKTTTVKVSIKPAGASKKVKFSSTKKKIAAVSKKGKVTAKKAGTTYIKVTAKDGSKKSARIKITVKKYVRPKSISVKAASSLSGGRTTKIKTTFKPGTTTEKGVTYKSSNKTLATVNSKGIVTANKKNKTGVVTITVQSKAKTSKKKALKKSVKIKIVKKVEASKVILSSGSRTITKTGRAANPTVTLTAAISPASTYNKALTWKSSDTHIATVNSKGVITAKNTGKANITVKTANGKTAVCKLTVRKTTVPVHDPSIFKDPKTGKYYTVGTGMAMAVSEDLEAWTTCKSGTALLKNGITELKPLFDYTGLTNMGNVWAGDMIYNVKMKKYCMYVCAQNNTWTAIIGMLTADNAEGPYTYAGTIVCSDFTKNSIEKTNIRTVLGLSKTDEIPSRYFDANETGTVNSSYYRANFPDAIDPAPYYDAKGNLYLTYGSFTAHGGLCTIKLDPNTGLRSTSYNYSYAAGESDPYFGKKISTRYGEGPYIQQVKSSKSSTGYYYFFWYSVGALRATGDYNMRMYRSENPDGPYVDAAGNNIMNGLNGVRVMYNYKFSFMKYAHTAMGGNSAFVDDDGKMYIVYHNKFSDNSPNPGSHMVKVHQMFLNEDGWLVTAPFEYNGETIKSSYTASQVAGNYEFVRHNSSKSTSVGSYNYVLSEKITLSADGKVSGVYTGTWTLKNNLITVTIGDQQYKGVVLEQYADDGNNGMVSSGEKTLVFTAVGSDNLTIWGVKSNKTDAQWMAMDLPEVTAPATALTDFGVMTLGKYGSAITWSSSNTKAISFEGATAKVTQLDTDSSVIITAEIKNGAAVTKKNFTIKVPAYEIPMPSVIRDTIIVLPQATAQGTKIAWTSSDSSIIDIEGGRVTLPESGGVTVTLTAKYGTIVKKYTVTVMAKFTGEYIYKEDYETATDVLSLWQSTNAANFLSLQNDELHGNYVQFAPTGSTNSRGAVAEFGIDTDSVYIIEFDTYLKAGDNQNTNFAITGKDIKYYNNNINDGIESEYILKLDAQAGSTTWTVSGAAAPNDTVVIPAEWVHVSVAVDKTTKNATVVISNGDVTYYEGVVSINGTGDLNGLYVRAGRYNPVFKVDNIKVY